MTSVSEAVQTGRGRIGASFREIPAVALPQVRRLVRQLESIGLGAVLMVGRPNQPLLDIPVVEGRAGIQTENLAMGALYDFSRLVSYKDINF